MQKDLMQLMGFDREVDRVNNGVCPFCSNEIDIDDFTDDLSKTEFRISGLCQTCQDNEYDESINEDDDEIIRK